VARYCSEACQREHWSNHHWEECLECQKLIALQEAAEARLAIKDTERQLRETLERQADDAPR
jgi:hypothetical protein